MDSEEFEWLMPTPPLQQEDSFCVQDFDDEDDQSLQAEAIDEYANVQSNECSNELKIRDSQGTLSDSVFDSTSTALTDYTHTELSLNLLPLDSPFICSTAEDPIDIHEGMRHYKQISREVMQFATDVVHFKQAKKSNINTPNPQLFGILWASSSHRSQRKLRQILVLLLAATDICSLLKANKTATKRELYYHHTDLYQSQMVLDKAVRRIANHLGAKLSCLGIQSSSKVLLYGCISLVTKNDLISASTSSSVSIAQYHLNNLTKPNIHLSISCLLLILFCL